MTPLFNRMRRGYAKLGRAALQMIGWTVALVLAASAITLPLWALARYAPGLYTGLVAIGAVGVIGYLLVRRALQRGLRPSHPARLIAGVVVVVGFFISVFAGLLPLAVGVAVLGSVLAALRIA